MALNNESCLFDSGDIIDSREGFFPIPTVRLFVSVSTLHGMRDWDGKFDKQVKRKREEFEKMFKRLG